jgi:ribosome-associated translation inhibitor RaiA
VQIQINTDHNIQGYEAAAERVRTTIAGSLSRFSGYITRVEVHLSDENANKSGPDHKRCMMEARLQGHQPIAVTHQAATLGQAIDGAIDKLNHRLDSTLGRLHNHRSHLTDPTPPEVEPPEA